jgi:hypothetical protein
MIGLCAREAPAANWMEDIMLKKIFLAGATAGVIAVSSFAAMTTAASAAPPPPPMHHKHGDCRLVARSVKWYDHHGHPHWKRVLTWRCGYLGPHPRPYWFH